MDTEDLIGILSRASREPLPRAGTLPTGSVSLDVILGGGWPHGSVSELYGPPDSGTTTVALRSIAAAQKAHPNAVAVMYDGSPDGGARLPDRAAGLGADLDRLIVAGRPEALLALPRETVLTVIDGLSENQLPPREDLGATVLVIPRDRSLARAAARLEMQHKYGSRWAWARLVAPMTAGTPGCLPMVPVSLAGTARIQEILYHAFMYGLVEVSGKRWYYCGQRKFAGSWDDAVTVLQDDSELLAKITSGIAAKTGLNDSNWLT